MKYVKKIIVCLMFLGVVSACSNESDKISNKSVIKIPPTLQKLTTVAAGVLKAYIIIDGDEGGRIEMDIDTSGEGSAQVTIPNLSRTEHNFIIVYEFTDSNGVLVLATASSKADLSSGSVSLNVSANDYDLDIHDEDGDGVNNAEELLLGTNPRTLPETLVALGVFSGIPQLNLTAQGRLKATLILDGDSDNVRVMNIDAFGNNQASLTVQGLTKKIYIVTVVFEYTDIDGVLTIATIDQEINLNFGTRRLELILIDFETSLFDEDNDGVSNADELFVGSNPRLVEKPFIPASPSISFEKIKTFRFSWNDVGDATLYRLLENIDGKSPFEKVGNDIPAGVQNIEQSVSLYERLNSQYILQSCNAEGCTDSEIILIDGTLLGSIGFFKSDIPTTNFGSQVSLSRDGKVLAVSRQSGDVYVFRFINNQWKQEALIAGLLGINNEISLSAVGNTLAIGGATATAPGVVYIYAFNGNDWVQQTVIEPSVIDVGGGDFFGVTISLSADGNTLAVGSRGEDSDSVGVGGDPLNNAASGSGAAYVFNRIDTNWQQNAYIKASNTDIGDEFGRVVRLSADGTTLAVGAMFEDSSAIGINSSLQADNSASKSGAVYVFKLNDANNWSQEAYVKADDVAASDTFGFDISLNENGAIMAVTGKYGFNISASGNVGAVYVFSQGASNVWLQQAKLIKPGSQADFVRNFGLSVSLNGMGNLLAVSVGSENPFIIGVNLPEIRTAIGVAQNVAGPGVYTFIRENNNWNVQAHINANAGAFGLDIGLSGDGATLAVGARGESTNLTGVSAVTDGASGIDQVKTNDPTNFGAVFLY